jgi:hypothetical protein
LVAEILVGALGEDKTNTLLEILLAKLVPVEFVAVTSKL